MPRDTQQTLMPSVLDRLIDTAMQDGAARPWYGLEQMVDAVQRDLEDLLNTRQSHDETAHEFPEVERSMATYGLPDLTALTAVTSHQREQIGRSIEEVVQRFEPRLKQVRAVLQDGGDNKLRSLRYRLEAKLNVDPAPEVAFDTTLELSTGYYSVKSTAT
jgi:type VI secretion system protein ImpF